MEQAYIDSRDQANEHGVHAGDRRRDSLPESVPLASNWLSPVIASKAEALAFVQADVLSARMS